MIRAAVDADAEAIAEIQARTWRWAYGDFIAPEDMPAGRVEAWREHVAAGAVRVFDHDGAVVGYTALDDDELKSLYVDPPAQGAGVGRALLAASVEALRAAGHTEAFLWCFEANGLARAFYERHGWKLVPGARQDHIAPEVRYRLAL